jgi:hypothetical protein
VGGDSFACVPSLVCRGRVTLSSCLHDRCCIFVYTVSDKDLLCNHLPPLLLMIWCCSMSAHMLRRCSTGPGPVLAACLLIIT